MLLRVSASPRPKTHHLLLTDQVVSNEAIIGSFLSTLGSLPVTLFLLVLLLELCQRFTQIGLQSLPLGHLDGVRDRTRAALRCFWFIEHAALIASRLVPHTTLNFIAAAHNLCCQTTHSIVSR